ncbi:MAG: DNA-processing protein DprA [Sneathiella sp.]
MEHQKDLSTVERLDWLRLIRSENVGPITFFQLIDRFGNAKDALAAIPELARKGGRKKPIRICAKSTAEQEMEEILNFGGHMIAACESTYPTGLKQIADPPPIISVKGQSQLLKKDIIGIVGSRNASAVSMSLTQQFSTGLGRGGLVVASGLARGIDTAAHKAALTEGTIAVVGGGINISYPKENHPLQEAIGERGCLIAEQPFNTQPQARHFPRRNRIISGISIAILVMEATPRSGSLITARMAAEQGRDVFAVPGSPMDPRARGSNNLIRNGAILAEDAGEILQELASSRGLRLSEPDQPLLPFNTPRVPDETEIEEARPRILSLLSPTAVNIDEIIRLSELAPATVMTILLELELAGRIERHFGNRVSFTS